MNKKKTFSVCLLFLRTRFTYNYCLFEVRFYLRHKTDVGEDWAFATKLTGLSENFEDENETGYSDLEIFQVKFLGCSTIHAEKSEEATANAIKTIIATAKGIIHTTL